MSTGWQWTIGLLVAGAYIWLWASSEFDLSQEARLDRHNYARVALEEEVRVLQHEVSVLRDLVRRQDKQIDCYYETVVPQRNVYQRREAESACLELK